MRRRPIRRSRRRRRRPTSVLYLSALAICFPFGIRHPPATARESGQSGDDAGRDNSAVHAGTTHRCRGTNGGYDLADKGNQDSQFAEMSTGRIDAITYSRSFLGGDTTCIVRTQEYKRRKAAAHEPAEPESGNGRGRGKARRGSRRAKHIAHSFGRGRGLIPSRSLIRHGPRDGHARRAEARERSEPDRVGVREK